MQNKKNISPAELYKQYSDDIFRYAFSILRNFEEAKDALQEVFVRYVESKNNYREECNYKTWLFTITRNYSYDKLKQKRKNNIPLEDLPGLSFSNDDLDDLISLREALQQLTEEQNELIYLRDYEGYSYQEIALLTGQSLDNVKIKLFRAKKKLKELLK